MRTLNKVQKAWSDKVGRDIAFKQVNVTTFDGREQTQLINPETGAIVVAVNKVGEKAQVALIENAGAPFIDAAFSQPEIDGPNVSNQVDKGADVPRPANNPGAAVETETKKPSDEDVVEVLPEDNPNAKLVELNERAVELGVEGAGDFKKKTDAVEAINAHKAETGEEE